MISRLADWLGSRAPFKYKRLFIRLACKHNEPFHFHPDGCPACCMEEYRDLWYDAEKEIQP